ncbi:hypothetical protein COW46_01230 [Candidatus Gracilibacteria bacterium CG17_big_fil_post_rev_8_21_14_2_50_48_13]|nr:MAG: hypothetical protein COW46_01230 [Candidatus Gracilibacteria bacterium CG17_big_fil_post_rev_8_21_14_2_50_48_13]
MYPFELHIDLLGVSLNLGPYGLFLGLALTTAVVVSVILGTRVGYPWKKQLLLLSLMGVFALLGARLFFALGNWATYAADPVQFLAWSSSGFSLYGGFLFAGITALIGAWILQWSPTHLSDTWIPVSGLSIALVRIGCFLHGCCFGVETDLPWGVTFPFTSPAHLYQLEHGGSLFSVHAVHPTELYEGASALVLALLLLTMPKTLLPRGTGLRTALFLGVFSFARLLIGFVRAQTDSAPVWMYPLIYIVVLFLSIIWGLRHYGVYSKHTP